MNRRIPLFFLLMLPACSAAAHQPRIVENSFVEVSNPEVSQAFYAELKGEPAIYQIRSETPFRLYVGLLLPDLPGVRKDISAEISCLDGGKAERLAFLDGANFSWTPFYERFAGDNYLWGPEYGAPDSNKEAVLKGRNVRAGTYRIRVFNSDNRGKYSLALGDLERWPLREVLNTMVAVPRIKKVFFEKSFTNAFFNRFTGFFAALLTVLSFILTVLARRVYRIFRKPPISNSSGVHASQAKP